MNTYGKTASYGQLLLYNLLKIKIFFLGYQVKHNQYQGLGSHYQLNN